MTFQPHYFVVRYLNTSRTTETYLYIPNLRLGRSEMAESTPPPCHHHHHLRGLHATPARHDQVSIWPGSGECETHTLASRGLEAHHAAEVLCATTTVVEDTARWLEPARRQWAGRGDERTVTRTAGLLDAAALLRLVHELVPYQKVQRKQYGALQPTIISLTRHQIRGKCNHVVKKIRFMVKHWLIIAHAASILSVQ